MTNLVLVVDDNEIDFLIIKAILEKVGMQIMFASDGFKAFELIKSRRPDIVFTDLEMPDCNGFQLLDLIRGADEKIIANLPVIALTELYDGFSVCKFLNSSFCDILVKPPNEKLTTLMIELYLKLNKSY